MHSMHRLKREAEVRAARERLNAKLRAENEELRRRLAGAEEARQGWELLQRNLEEHLEDLYCWREVQNEGETDPKKRIDVKSQIKATASSKDFAQQFAALNEKLEEENRTLLRILGIKDALALRKDVVDKQGYLVKKGQRNHSWKKRWFVLRGGVLSYYLTEDAAAEAKASISLASCSVAPEQADAADKEHTWLFAIAVEGRKLVLHADSQKDRDRWLAALNGAIAYQQYKKEAEDADSRPDLRLLSFFSSDSVPTLHLDDRPVSMETIMVLIHDVSYLFISIYLLLMTVIPPSSAYIHCIHYIYIPYIYIHTLHIHTFNTCT